MRIIFFLIAACSVLIGAGQVQLANQIKNIINDSANRFTSLKGTFKELQGVDSIYLSSINIEGTSKNEIFIGSNMNTYIAHIVDSIKEKKGKRLIDEWRQKLISKIGRGSKKLQTKAVSYNPAKYGWIYKRGDVTIAIDLYPHAYESSLYWVLLSFTYFNMNFINLNKE